MTLANHRVLLRSRPTDLASFHASKRRAGFREAPAAFASVSVSIEDLAGTTKVLPKSSTPTLAKAVY
jgi:hypothetical protein